VRVWGEVEGCVCLITLALYCHIITRMILLCPSCNSIGIEDVAPSQAVSREKAALVAGGYERCDGFISQFKRGELQLLPGADALQSLEQVGVRVGLTLVRNIMPIGMGLASECARPVLDF
jgi:hypothetical protein